MGKGPKPVTRLVEAQPLGISEYGRKHLCARRVLQARCDVLCQLPCSHHLAFQCPFKLQQRFLQRLALGRIQVQGLLRSACGMGC